MAKAIKNSVEVEKVVKVKSLEIQLTLTWEEAVVLRAVVGQILGSREDDRKHTSAIFDALDGAGVDYISATPVVRQMSGHIHLGKGMTAR